PYLLVGWLWYLGTLVPVIGLVQVGSQSMADRYTYIPLIGVCLALVWGLDELTQRWRHQAAAWSTVGAVALVVSVRLTHHQIGYWKDGVTAWNHAIAVTENNYAAHNNLAHILIAEGRLDEALEQYQEAVRLRPDFAEAQYNLGYALAQKGRVAEAIPRYQK